MVNIHTELAAFEVVGKNKSILWLKRTVAKSRIISCLSVHLTFQPNRQFFYFKIGIIKTANFLQTGCKLFWRVPLKQTKMNVSKFPLPVEDSL